jgi:hypothetical protein
LRLILKEIRKKWIKWLAGVGVGPLLPEWIRLRLFMDLIAEHSIRFKSDIISYHPEKMLSDECTDISFQLSAKTLNNNGLAECRLATAECFTRKSLIFE